MNYIKNNLFSIFIIVLLSIFIFKNKYNYIDKTNKSDTIKSVTTIKIVEKIGTTIVNKPILHDVQPYQFDTKDTIYYPDTTYKGLLTQYRNILDSLLATKTFNTEHKLDTIGVIKLKNIVQNNELKTQIAEWNVKIPNTTNTITLREQSRRILYIGGGLQGNQLSLINQVNIGIAYKNKKDNIFSLYTGVNPNTNINYGFNYFIPIKLRK